MYSKVFSVLETEQTTPRTTISDLRSALSQNLINYLKATAIHNFASQMWGP